MTQCNDGEVGQAVILSVRQITSQLRDEREMNVAHETNIHNRIFSLLCNASNNKIFCVCRTGDNVYTSSLMLLAI